MDSISLIAFSIAFIPFHFSAECNAIPLIFTLKKTNPIWATKILLSDGSHTITPSP